MNALHLAVEYNNYKAVKLLVHYGAKINVFKKYSNEKFVTPLNIAITNHFIECICILLLNNANINLLEKKIVIEDF